MSMESKASELMGEPVQAGVLLISKEALKAARVGGIAGGAVGAAVAGAMAGKKQASTTPGGFNGYFFLAVGPSSVAFLAAKMGMFAPSVEKLLDKRPRGELQSMEIGGGTITHEVKFVFADGTTYALQCHSANMGKLKKAKSLLEAPTPNPG